MALSIGVSCEDRIAVGEHEVVVRAIVNPTLIILQVDGGPDVIVTDQESVEIVPNVKVFAGQGKKSLGNRLAFKAPREIVIYRLGEEKAA